MADLLRCENGSKKPPWERTVLIKYRMSDIDNYELS